LLWPRRRIGRGSCLHPLEVVGQVVLLLSIAWCIPHLQGSYIVLHSSIGQSPVVPTMVVSATTTTTTPAVQPCSYSTAAAGSSKATIAGSYHWFLMLQLPKDWPLCMRLPRREVKQFATSSDTHGQSIEGLAEGPYTTVWLCQLHHSG
jgi:hypothetical protein